MGIAFIEGIGVPYNPSQAATYFKSAADQGIKEAAYNLGLIYENGLLGRSQPDEALAWYKTAADAGSPEAKAALEQLAKSLGIKIEDVNAIADTVKLGDAAPKKAAVETPKKKEITEAPVTAPRQEVVQEELIQEGLAPLNDADLALGGNAFDAFAPSPLEQEQMIISQIQEYLMGLGLFPGPADGVSGPLMQDAIRSYQSLNGLKTDGEASQTLLSHMLASGSSDYGLEGPNDVGSRSY